MVAPVDCLDAPVEQVGRAGDVVRVRHPAAGEQVLALTRPGRLVRIPLAFGLSGFTRRRETRWRAEARRRRRRPGGAPGVKIAPGSKPPVAPIPPPISSHLSSPRCSSVRAAFVCGTRSFAWRARNAREPFPPAKCPVVSRIMTLQGTALRGRRARYCAMATIPPGPLSSIALLPSVWQWSATISFVRPGMKPIRLRLLTCFTAAGSVSRAVAPASPDPSASHRHPVDVESRDAADVAVIREVGAIRPGAGKSRLRRLRPHPPPGSPLAGGRRH